MTTNPEALAENLAQFTGSQEFYRHPIARRVIYTEGVKYLAEQAGAYWLIDAIASYIGDRRTMAVLQAQDDRAYMLFWKLERKGKGAVLAARVDSGVPPCIKQGIPYTDFPLESIDLWAIDDGDHWTILLPSEY